MAKRKYHRQIFQKNKKSRWFFFTIKLLGFLFFVSIFIGFALFVFYAKDLPRPEKFTERIFVESTKIYDRTGETLLYEIYGEERRKVVPLDAVPEYLKQGVMIAEDANFYNHFGIDFKGILRAALVNLRLGKPIQGGSTISQQLIRSSMLTRKKTLERKIREVILTLELERRYSKDQILEWYLNQVPFGSNAYGVEAASQTFFQKNVSEISIGEAAILAALIQAPSRLSPYGENKPQLFNRVNLILETMVKAGILTEKEKNQIKKEEIDFAEILRPIKAPHFVFYVKNYLLSKYGEEFLKEKGLRVYTSLNWEFQKLAEKVVQKGAENNIGYRALNASLVAIAPQTGEILAMVGSKNFFGESFPEGCISGENCLFEPQFNVALGGEKSPGRQPGSAFKPFVYATAFKKGYNDKTIVVDEETNFGIWGGKPYIPQNYDGIFRGPVTLRAALAQSLNVPSVKVLVDLAGIEASIRTAEEFGITTLNMPISFYGPSLVLGGGEIRLLDIVSGYSVFAARGMKVPPVSILKITDSNGNIIEENKKTQKRVLDAKIADLITDILSDNTARSPMFGSNSLMYFEDFQVAAKTGTTGNFRDGWIIGYTPSIAVGVWVGNNDNSPMFKQPGIVTAGPIWRAFMEKILSKP